MLHVVPMLYGTVIPTSFNSCIFYYGEKYVYIPRFAAGCYHCVLFIISVVVIILLKMKKLRTFKGWTSVNCNILWLYIALRAVTLM